MVLATTVMNQLRHQSRRRRRGAERAHQRLDIQGLRMVAVLTVFAFHLCGWPRGGFVGVDVFFVISGFLITGNLLRMAETRGNVSFKRFYWNRVRRIIPAATVVLILTYAASVLVFQPFRAHQVGVDASLAFFFMSNWWFAAQRTDYFAAGDAVSPIQHYWSLSIEEQFYFVWPALIFLIGLLVVRHAWTHRRRMLLAAAMMASVVAVSLGWALYETAASSTWAYFNTFARVWELGVGALLATMIGVLARIPVALKPWLSWTGLGLIAASLLLINENSGGFPAPWALLPVAGAALVIAAGVGGEPAQRFLQNPVSVYVGNISYSLYLVHWPVIVILAALTPRSASFYLAAVTITVGLAIGSYHFVENPLRYCDWSKVRSTIHEIRCRRFHPQQSSRYATLAVLTLFAVGLTAYAVQPPAHHPVPSPVAAAQPSEAQVGPLTTALQNEIARALTATEWPPLNPSMETAIEQLPDPPEVHVCGAPQINPADIQACTWGSASMRVVIVGDSVAVAYGGPLREIALHGQIQLHVAAMSGCKFIDATLDGSEQSCSDAKQREVDLINSTRPDVVIISNAYSNKRLAGSDRWMTPAEWSDSLRRIIEKFRGNTKQVVLLSAPPADENIKECYTRSSVPADCISRVGETWLSMADAEQDAAKSVGGVWIDSRPWFCHEGLCPSFVGSTPAKRDVSHMSMAYGAKLYPVIGESLRAAGVL